MKKQELIHLHGLLAQVEHHYEQETGDTIAHEEYDSLGVQPTSIHKSKTDHKAAVLALTEGITSELETDQPISASAN